MVAYMFYVQSWLDLFVSSEISWARLFTFSGDIIDFISAI